MRSRISAGNERKPIVDVCCFSFVLVVFIVVVAFVISSSDGLNIILASSHLIAPVLLRNFISAMML